MQPSSAFALNFWMENDKISLFLGKRAFIMQEIKVELTKNPKEKPAPGAPLPIGTIYTDQMYIKDYN